MNADEQRVARQIEQLRACAGDYRQFSADCVHKWLAWWETHHRHLDSRGPLPRQAYALVLLLHMGLDPREVPVVYEDDRTIIWRSTNFCPTLETCRRLGLGTRIVCRTATEPADFWAEYRHMQAHGVRFAEAPREERYGRVVVFWISTATSGTWCSPRMPDCTIVEVAPQDRGCGLLLVSASTP